MKYRPPPIFLELKNGPLCHLGIMYYSSTKFQNDANRPYCIQQLHPLLFPMFILNSCGLTATLGGWRNMKKKTFSALPYPLLKQHNFFYEPALFPSGEKYVKICIINNNNTNSFCTFIILIS